METNSSPSVRTIIVSKGGPEPVLTRDMVYRFKVVDALAETREKANQVFGQPTTDQGYKVVLIGFFKAEELSLIFSRTEDHEVGVRFIALKEKPELKGVEL